MLVALRQLARRQDALSSPASETLQLVCRALSMQHNQLSSICLDSTYHTASSGVSAQPVPFNLAAAAAAPTSKRCQRSYACEIHIDGLNSNNTSAAGLLLRSVPAAGSISASNTVVCGLRRHFSAASGIGGTATSSSPEPAAAAASAAADSQDGAASPPGEQPAEHPAAAAAGDPDKPQQEQPLTPEEAAAQAKELDEALQQVGMLLAMLTPLEGVQGRRYTANKNVSMPDQPSP